MRTLSVVALVLLAPLASAQLTVVAVDPPLNSGHRAPNADVVVDFDRAVSAASLGAVEVYGNVGGTPAGTLTLENGGTRLRFRPARPWFANEIVRIHLANTLQATDSSFLRSSGYVSTFRVAAAPASMAFTEIQSFFTEPGTFTRIYGAQPVDLDGDDWIDMAVVNEVTQDVRVFKNTGNGSGTFATTATSINPVPAEPSPNENGDMDGDGYQDIVTCNATGDSVSVLLGRGDGTFQPAVSYAMGNEPHGLALLDCDGDGDLDVFTASYGSEFVARRLNNGDGTLGAMSWFDVAGGEYGITAADMDNDGIQDLVVGNRWSASIVVMRCNGNGTFSNVGSQAAGGQPWMVVCGDVNGDGNMDVSSANGFSANASILLGNGDGTLQAAQVVSLPGSAIATRVADLDGDVDLDWVISSFSGSVWRVYRNNGGVMQTSTTFTSGANPGCATVIDIDDDRDLDIVLLTETSDEIRVARNGPTGETTFCYGWAFACPCGNGGLPGHGCEHSFGIGGGLLTGQGVASVGADTFALNAGGLPPAASTLFFQGTTQAGGGAGTAFGDGLRCTAGSVIRLGTKFTANGWASYGAGNPGDTPVSIRGAIPTAGGTRHYQAWFRNSAPFCTGDVFNLTNGVTAAWTP